MTNAETSPNYDLTKVEAVILEVAAELHPEHESAAGLLAKIVRHPEDTKEIQTGRQAIRNLREVGLFANRDDDVVELTPAALCACALLMQSSVTPSA